MLEKTKKSRKLKKIILTKKTKAFQSFREIFMKLDRKKFRDIEKRNQRETGNVEYFMLREKNQPVEDKGFKVDFKENFVNNK